MEQKNQQTKKSVGSIVLAVILGICVIVLAASDGLLFVTMQRFDQIGHYAEKESGQQEEDVSEASAEREDSISASMSGFVVGDTGTSEKKEESKTKDNGISNEDYILPDSDSKYYTNKDLKKLTREEVKLARNEIYARHGRKFVVDMKVKEYFEGKDWYQGTVDEVSDSELNKYEIANRDLIIQYEKKKKWN